MLVIDEAGMVGSRQLARFVGEAERAGAKLVLVGDHEQLQAIGAGAPFRAVAERIGHAELSDIRRQRQDWQREASRAFATHRTGEGLAAYREHGAIQVEAGRDEARGAIVRDILADMETRPDGTRVAMAHRRADVRALNADIRSALQERGALGKGEAAGERTYQTNDGERAFAPGDRIVFLENSRQLGVKNGMLGTVEQAEEGRLVTRLDGAGRNGEERRVSVPTDQYQALDHGYATTIHKTQGATVDRSFVLASATMDRHLTYVAMTRHRDEARLYADGSEFAGREAGRLVEHGRAPFEHRAENRPSYFVTLEDAAGEKRTTWGVDLERAMTEAKPAIGATIGLARTGSEAVRLADGTTAERHGWAVREAGELAHAGLEARLSRSGAKETVLDYPREVEAQAFAERRGIADALGIRSEIAVPREPEQAGEVVERTRRADRAEVTFAPEAARSRDNETAAERPRQSMFDGLKLGRRSSAPQVQPEREARESAPRKRSMFDGLKLGAGSRSAAASRLDRAEAPSTEDRLADRLQPLSPFGEALDRYARAHGAAERHVEMGLPVLEAQKKALAEAGQALDAARPGSQALVRSTLEHNSVAARAVREQTGRDRLGTLAAGMERERMALADPTVRADRFVARWQDLAAQRDTLKGWQHEEARGQVEGRMRTLQQSLKQDPEANAVLRERAAVQERDGAQRERPELAMTREQERGVQRSRGMGMEM